MTRQSSTYILRWVRSNTLAAIAIAHFCRLLAFALFEIQRTEEESLDIEDSRRIVLSWDSGTASFPNYQEGRSMQGFRLLLKSVSSNGTIICFTTLGRVLEADPYFQPREFFLPITNSQVDVHRIRGWLSTCERSHASTCILDPGDSLRVEDVFSGLSTLRLLDVQSLCIVERDTYCRYMTLSYVWGATQSLRLTRANRKRLVEPRFFGTILESVRARHMIPKTIKDAIDLVRQLGEQYLWIDSLCLVQDDPEDVARGVASMDRIYEHSVLTIVAASGAHANIGLPGVQRGSRHAAQVIEQVRPGMSMSVYTSLDYLLWPTVYSSRGWTFQEQLLSRRALVFVDNQVYFQCRQRVFSENCNDALSQVFHDRGMYRAWYPAASKLIKMENPLPDYMWLLQHYTKRSFTYQGDVLMAIKGIMRRFSERLKCSFFKGVPRLWFDSCLFFLPKNNTILRRRQGFPSYSWTGWIGPILFAGASLRFGSRPRGGEWIEWHKRLPSGATSPVWDFAVEAGLFEDGTPSWHQRRVFESNQELPFPTTRTQPSDTVESLIVPVEYPLLCFWTLSAFFSIKNVSVMSGTSYLFDRDGACCGNLYMDGYEDGTFFDNEESIEFIAVSALEIEFPFSEEVFVGNSLPRPRMANGDFYQVLCLQWTDGIAERRGAGQVVQSAFTRSLDPGPSWKEIHLA